MKFSIFLLLILTISENTSAAPFIPQTMTLQAPAIVDYDFEGDLEIPVTISGTPGKLFFLVFTNGKSGEIRDVRNGYRGWHYVNRIDTCIYYDLGTDYGKGDHVITWDGRDRDGNPATADIYTYYLFAYDNQTPKIRAINLPDDIINYYSALKYVDHEFVTTNPDGYMLPQPIVYIDPFGGDPDGGPLERVRWHIGDDPGYPELKETCIILDTYMEHNLQPDPYDENHVFTLAVDADAVAHVRRYEWVTGGTAVHDTAWGTDGEYAYPLDAIDAEHVEWEGLLQSFNYVGDDTFIATNTAHFSLSDIAELKRFSAFDGTEHVPIDLSGWWIRPQDGLEGGQQNGGPNQLYVRDGHAIMSAHGSCLVHCINPTREGGLDVWANDNGDTIGDRNYEQDAMHPWVCFDYNAVPNTYNISSDANLFTLNASKGLGMASFALYAPDGTGIGNYGFIDDGGCTSHKNEIIDVGGPYDGIYIDHASLFCGGFSIDEQHQGLFYVAHDSFRGVISNTSGPFIQIAQPSRSTVWGVGTEHTISWEAGRIWTVDIRYSTDGGETWLPIADDVPANTGTWVWTVPADTQSDNCLVAIDSADAGNDYSVMTETFEIAGPLVRIESPNGGELLEADTTTDITWSSIGIDAVDISYTPDNGQTWLVIAENVEADQRKFTWNVPPDLGEGYRIMIADSSTPFVFDLSDDYFSVVDSFLRISSPTAGDTWEVWEMSIISWDASSSVTNITIELSTNGGITWQELATVGPQPSLYILNTPFQTSESCLVKISSRSPFLTDTSSSFTIRDNDDEWVTFTQSDGIPTLPPHTIADDEKGGVWIAGYCAAHFDGIRWMDYISEFTGVTRGGEIYTMAVAENDVWFGATWACVWHFDGSSFTYRDDLPMYPRDMAVDGDGILWIGTMDEGLVSYDGNSISTIQASPEGLRNNGPEVVAVDGDNTLWIGYKYRSGLSHYDGAQWTHYTPSDGLASFEVWAIDFDGDGVVWVGTSEGVSRFDGATWTTYTTADGLADDEIQALAVDNNDIVWAATRQGVSAFDGATWTTYTSENSGLVSDNVREIAVDTHNFKWFATSQGLSRFAHDISPYLQLSRPAPGETFDVSEPVAIEWEAYQVNRLSIEYSADGGTTWHTITDGCDAMQGYYLWTPTTEHNKQYMVRITDTADESVSDVVERPFSYLVTGIEEESLPMEFSLGDNYPNPFNPSTTIPFTLPVAGHVSLSVYNIAGQRVAELANGYFPAGHHECVWSPDVAATGLYFYRIIAGDHVSTKKMLLVK